MVRVFSANQAKGTSTRGIMRDPGEDFVDYMGMLRRADEEFTTVRAS